MCSRAERHRAGKRASSRKVRYGHCAANGAAAAAPAWRPGAGRDSGELPGLRQDGVTARVLRPVARLAVHDRVLTAFRAPRGPLSHRRPPGRVRGEVANRRPRLLLPPGFGLKGFRGVGAQRAQPVGGASDQFLAFAAETPARPALVSAVEVDGPGVDRGADPLDDAGQGVVLGWFQRAAVQQVPGGLAGRREAAAGQVIRADRARLRQCAARAAHLASSSRKGGRC